MGGCNGLAVFLARSVSLSFSSISSLYNTYTHALTTYSRKHARAHTHTHSHSLKHTHTHTGSVSAARRSSSPQRRPRPRASTSPARTPLLPRLPGPPTPCLRTSPACTRRLRGGRRVPGSSRFRPCVRRPSRSSSSRVGRAAAAAEAAAWAAVCSSLMWNGVVLRARGAGRRRGRSRAWTQHWRIHCRRWPTSWTLLAAHWGRRRTWGRAVRFCHS